MLPHAPEERLDVIDGGGVYKGAVVEDQADPEVVHQDREAGHDGEDTPWTTELIPGRRMRVKSKGGV